MPHPIDYVSGQDDDQIRSIDAVHIEPSIREGVHLVSSLYGKDASAPLTRFAPVNTAAPYLIGDPQIPSVLTCIVGTWPASPKANFNFQWMSNGADIPGATGFQWLSDNAYDLTTITCEVKGFNYMGEAYALSSNSIDISLIEPIEIFDKDIHAITGLNLPTRLITHNETTMITSGISTDTRLDVNRSVAYFTTGTSADTREDVNAMSFHVLTGLEQEKNITVQQHDSISIISYEQQQPLVEGVSQPINLKNNDADIGLMGWTVVGSARWHTLDLHDYEGSAYWQGGSSVSAGTGNIPYTYVYQDVEMFDIWEDDIDAGTCFLEWTWYQSSLAQQDLANVKLEFFNQGMISLGTADPQGLWAGPPEDYWVRVAHEVPIPVGTRFVRVIMEFSLIFGNDANGRIDYINARIRKGAKRYFLDTPTSTQFWRVDFTQARAYQGCAFSELEFRDAIGGADLATGGSIVFGSEGNGGLASYAFDDIRAGGNYWAGEQNAVANGKSWIGYNFGSPVRPRELDFTLRPNNAALDFGRDFMLQQSEDGNAWYDVQFYKGIPDPIPLPSQQQLQFEVLPVGPFPAARTFITSASYFRSSLQIDDVATKGCIFRSKVRMEITHLSWHNYVSAVAWDAVLRVGKATFQNGAWHCETIHEVIDVPMAAGAGNFWRESALITPYEVDVNDYFYIIVTDLQAASNPIDANEGRVVYLQSVETTRGYTWDEQPTHTRWWYYSKNDTVITPGDQSTNDSNLGRPDYAVDFRGNII